MTIELSIVSGTYNRLSLLQKMVASVRTSARGVSYEIVLVDGGSTDGTLAWCKAQPDIRLIEQAALIGAIKAFHAGFKAATGRYVVIGGDDMEYLGDCLQRAFVFMESHPEAGVGALYQDRGGQGFHVSPMPAHLPNGQQTTALYGQKCIVPRWLGDLCGWWGAEDPIMDKARTYGGDNYLSARAWEMGYPTVAIEGCRIHEVLLSDELNKINNPPKSGEHPDTALYLQRFPQGPELGHQPTVRPPERRMRILYAPIYEPGHKIQHVQKNGLRRALQRRGLVVEVDYIEVGPESLLSTAALWKPDFLLTQFHDGNLFKPVHARQLRTLLPSVRWANWNGDVYDRSVDPAYIEVLRYSDVQTVVNASSVPNYARQGVQALWWQCAYEPDGVGIEPDKDTPRHDVIFLGNGYRQERHALGNFIHSLPYDTGIYGDYWQFPTFPPCLYDFRRGCQLYQNAKIALGDSDWTKEGGRGFVSNRPFQAMAAGGALMMQQWFDGCEDMLKLIDGQHLILWRDYDDLRTRINYWLDPAHEAERQQIARQGQAEVLRHHSFEARVKGLFAALYPPVNPAAADPTLAAFYETVRHG